MQFKSLRQEEDKEEERPIIEISEEIQFMRPIVLEQTGKDEDLFGALKSVTRDN